MNEIEAVITLAQGFTKEDQRKIIEELEKKAKPIDRPLVRSWEDAYKAPSYFMRAHNIGTWTSDNANESSIECFRFFNQAESSLAFAQLSHIVADANGEWEADWADTNQSKWCILRDMYYLKIEDRYRVFDELPMKSREIAEACLEMHRGLWEKFRML